MFLRNYTYYLQLFLSNQEFLLLLFWSLSYLQKLISVLDDFIKCFIKYSLIIICEEKYT